MTISCINWRQGLQEKHYGAIFLGEDRKREARFQRHVEVDLTALGDQMIAEMEAKGVRKREESEVILRYLAWEIEENKQR